jgi:hypothetical protein
MKMLQETQSLKKAPSTSEHKVIIQTTLYDLIEAVNQTVKSEETQLVAEIVMDLLNSGHAKLQNRYH